jgi:RNA recognition motif-containing protein
MKWSETAVAIKRERVSCWHCGFQAPRVILDQSHEERVLGEEAMSKLFVGNLSFKVTDADLQNWFEANGFPVESAEVMADQKTGRSRGIGFVVLKRNDQLKDAIDKLNGQTFNGRTVNVEEAKSPASNEGPHPQKRGRW